MSPGRPPPRPPWPAYLYGSLGGLVLRRDEPVAQGVSQPDLPLRGGREEEEGGKGIRKLIGGLK